MSELTFSLGGTTELFSNTPIDCFVVYLLVLLFGGTGVCTKGLELGGRHYLESHLQYILLELFLG
jgi:hypothetical protein